MVQREYSREASTGALLVSHKGKKYFKILNDIEIAKMKSPFEKLICIDSEEEG